MTTSPDRTEAERLVVELRRKLPGVSCLAFRGDNLAIFLASEFEPGVESDELDESGTWKQGALDLADQVMDAVHAHYARAIDTLLADVAFLRKRRGELVIQRDDERAKRRAAVAAWCETQADLDTAIAASLPAATPVEDGGEAKRPKVYHIGAALQGIADAHAEKLSSREREALYQAAYKLWDDGDALAKPSSPAGGDVREALLIARQAIWSGGDTVKAIAAIEAALSSPATPEPALAGGEAYAIKALMKAVQRAEDGAGTLPAKEAVKLRPSDWYAVCDRARKLAAFSPAPAPDQKGGE